MELLYIGLSFIAGAAIGYGFRAEVAQELAILTADFKAEVARLRVDLTRMKTKL